MTVPADANAHAPFAQAPSSKVTASALAGAVTLILVTELNRHFHAGIDATEASAITMILAFVAGYLMPHSQA